MWRPWAVFQQHTRCLWGGFPLVENQKSSIVIPALPSLRASSWSVRSLEFFFCLYSARVREQMGSKRVPEHDNIMSLLIIASSQADSGAIVNSYNRGSSKERQKLWWGRSSCRNQQDQGGRRQLVRPRADKHRRGQYWRMTSFTAQWHHNTVVMDFTIGVQIVSVKGTKKSQWIQ